jgi:colicin import membrane protein
MSEPRGDRVLPVVLSILIHAAIVGALVWGWWQYRAPTPPPQTLAIEATVVHDAPQSTPAPPAPAPAPPAPTPPPPDPQVEEQRQQAEKEAAAKAEAERQAQAEAEARTKAQSEAKAQAEAKATAAAKAEADAKAKAEAEETAAAAAKAKAEADAKAKVQAAAAAATKVEADRKAQQLAQQQRAEQEREQREADLRAQLKAEEHLDQARTNGALAQYQAMIAARIERAWIRPPSAHAGINCQVRITQVPGGAVTAVQVGGCNGDDAVRQSISDAAYRASPLPAPPDPALFDRDVVVTFAPHE